MTSGGSPTRKRCVHAAGTRAGRCHARLEQGASNMRPAATWPRQGTCVRARLARPPLACLHEGADVVRGCRGLVLVHGVARQRQQHQLELALPRAAAAAAARAPRCTCAPHAGASCRVCVCVGCSARACMHCTLPKNCARAAARPPHLHLPNGQRLVQAVRPSQHEHLGRRELRAQGVQGVQGRTHARQLGARSREQHTHVRHCGRTSRNAHQPCTCAYVAAVYYCNNTGRINHHARATAAAP